MVTVRPGVVRNERVWWPLIAGVAIGISATAILLAGALWCIVTRRRQLEQREVARRKRREDQ